MAKKSVLNPFALAVGTTLAGSLVGMGTALADANPFGLTPLTSGYQVAADTTSQAPSGASKPAEGKCGGNKKAEGKCGEGKCGGDKKTEGKCGGDKKTEGKCGEGKCGAKK